MNGATQPTGDVASAYDEPIVGLSFYTDDPSDPIAGFGDQVRLPVPDVGETVRFENEDLDGPEPADEDGDAGQYRVVDRTFEYRTVDYDGFSGEERQQLVVVVNIEVESISIS